MRFFTASFFRKLRLKKVYVNHTSRGDKAFFMCFTYWYKEKKQKNALLSKDREERGERTTIQIFEILFA